MTLFFTGVSNAHPANLCLAKAYCFMKPTSHDLLTESPMCTTPCTSRPQSETREKDSQISMAWWLYITLQCMWFMDYSSFGW